ncbi:MAG: hypothetical protein H7287_14650, partial [Thermoleophilia bacterium]|nr:hypothetical protein [Thermoleophilia bacterium]
MMAALLLVLLATHPGAARAVNFGVSQNSDMLIGASNYTDRALAQTAGVVGLWHLDTSFGTLSDSSANGLTLTP